MKHLVPKFMNELALLLIKDKTDDQLPEKVLRIIDESPFECLYESPKIEEITEKQSKRLEKEHKFIVEGV